MGIQLFSKDLYNNLWVIKMST